MSRPTAALWKAIAKRHFTAERRRATIAQALRAAERALYDLAEGGSETAREALEKVQPVAVFFDPDVEGPEKAIIESLHFDSNGLCLRGTQPHWAMMKMAQSFIESLGDALNYQCITAELGAAGGPRFDVYLRKIGHGKTVHELRREAETERDALKLRVAELETVLAERGAQ